MLFCPQKIPVRTPEQKPERGYYGGYLNRRKAGNECKVEIRIGNWTQSNDHTALSALGVIDSNTSLKFPICVPLKVLESPMCWGKGSEGGRGSEVGASILRWLSRSRENSQRRARNANLSQKNARLKTRQAPSVWPEKPSLQIAGRGSSTRRDGNKAALKSAPRFVKPAPMFLDRSFKRLAKVNNYLPPFGLKTQALRAETPSVRVKKVSSHSDERINVRLAHDFAQLFSVLLRDESRLEE
ncbi:ST3 beta-galactoside alpha-2,3-sialyltransferase 3b isoform X1 [Tachysurus ichikawai]